MNTEIGQTTFGELLPYILVVTFLLLVLIFCIRMVIVSLKTKQMGKQRRQELKNEGVTVHTFLKHVQGLPIAENAACEVFSYPERLEFKSGSMQISLSKEKILDICTTTDTDIQKHMFPALAGLLAGLFFLEHSEH